MKTNAHTFLVKEKHKCLKFLVKKEKMVNINCIIIIVLLGNRIKLLSYEGTSNAIWWLVI